MVWGRWRRFAAAAGRGGLTDGVLLVGLTNGAHHATERCLNSPRDRGFLLPIP